ncbi:endonuclease/exonuclease/phosphatase family protein [Pseudonocardia sp. TRM90224]|uniref:endonuclease/exonuclease/phosphatase family protein n=1 Tax=Pseudonocardia sp. TRM90224 TaxID=2812678 RepID=UPI001E2ED2A1|nr:endonuclease/exonuclease/phosphatase family protein [Pseudonocardia sp. TRM90224]
MKRNPVRVATWNLWWRFGDWRLRNEAIAATLAKLSADVIGLQEVWADGPHEQAGMLAERLGLQHAWCPAPSTRRWRDRLPGSEGITVGNAVLSRWPITRVRGLHLSDPGAPDGRVALLTTVATPAGRIDVCSTQLTSVVPDGSARRTRQLARLVRWLARTRTGGHVPLALVGDLNAEPDADEIRRLRGTGTTPFVPGAVFVDAWSYRGDSDPGYTWRRDNPHAATAGEPWARIDYVLLAPSATGLAAATTVGLFGTGPVGAVQPSDHAGVYADLTLP